MMGQLVIPAMCSILFILVIGSSEDAFAVLKTCDGNNANLNGDWTDAAVWSPPGQPASTDTVALINDCHLTVFGGTDVVLVAEAIPAPAGIDFFLPSASALENGLLVQDSSTLVVQKNASFRTDFDFLDINISRNSRITAEGDLVLTAVTFNLFGSRLFF